MPFDKKLANRLRGVLKRRQGITERRMFGGIAFMVNGHMAAGVQKNDLVLRLGEDGTRKAMEHKHVRPMDFTGKPLKSMVYVRPEGCRSDTELRDWIDRAVRFARSLPAK